MPQAVYAEIHGHLFGSNREEAAFGFARVDDVEGLKHFRVEDTYLAKHDDFDAHASYHIALTDDALERIIHRAWSDRRALVEFHSHLSNWPAAFSPSDLAGLSQFVPHVIWRLRQPYLAIVAASSGFDALCWTDMRVLPIGIKEMNVDGAVYRPTGRSINTFTARRSDSGR